MELITGYAIWFGNQYMSRHCIQPRSSVRNIEKQGIGPKYRVQRKEGGKRVRGGTGVRGVSPFSVKCQRQEESPLLLCFYIFPNAMLFFSFPCLLLITGRIRLAGYSMAMAGASNGSQSDRDFPWQSSLWGVRGGGFGRRASYPGWSNRIGLDHS